MKPKTPRANHDQRRRTVRRDRTPVILGDERDATSKTVTRAFVPDVRERARRSVPMPKTRADRVADERAYAEIAFRRFGADVQRTSAHRREPAREKYRTRDSRGAGSRPVQPRVGRRLGLRRALLRSRLYMRLKHSSSLSLSQLVQKGPHVLRLLRLDAYVSLQRTLKPSVIYRNGVLRFLGLLDDECNTRICCLHDEFAGVFLRRSRHRAQEIPECGRGSTLGHIRRRTVRQIFAREDCLFRTHSEKLFAIANSLLRETCVQLVRGLFTVDHELLVQNDEWIGHRGSLGKLAGAMVRSPRGPAQLQLVREGRID